MSTSRSAIFFHGFVHALLGMNAFAVAVALMMYLLDIGSPEQHARMFEHVGVSLLILGSLFVLSRHYKKQASRSHEDPPPGDGDTDR